MALPFHSARPFWQDLASLLGSRLEGEPRQGALEAQSPGSVPAGIVIWDLENCPLPTGYGHQVPALVKMLRNHFRASRVVTAAANPCTSGLTEQLRALTYCDVEVQTFFRPVNASASEKKYSCSDYMLKRVLSAG